jgi:hypothetical protein
VKDSLPSSGTPPSHFRLGFAAAGDKFSKALDRFGAFVKSWSAKMVTA